MAVPPSSSQHHTMHQHTRHPSAASNKPSTLRGQLQRMGLHTGATYASPGVNNGARHRGLASSGRSRGGEDMSTQFADSQTRFAGAAAMVDGEHQHRRRLKKRRRQHNHDSTTLGEETYGENGDAGGAAANNSNLDVEGTGVTADTIAALVDAGIHRPFASGSTNRHQYLSTYRSSSGRRRRRHGDDRSRGGTGQPLGGAVGVANASVPGLVYGNGTLKTPPPTLAALGGAPNGYGYGPRFPPVNGAAPPLPPPHYQQYQQPNIPPPIGSSQRHVFLDEPMSFAIVKTPVTFSIYGGSGTGKSVVQQTCLAAWNERFNIVFAICPTEKERQKQRWIIHEGLCKSQFDSAIIERITRTADMLLKNHIAIPSICMITDDMFTQDDDAAAANGKKTLQMKNNAALKTAYRRWRHLNVTILESKHDLSDTGKKNRASLHMVGMMSTAKREMQLGMFQIFFAPFFKDFLHFESAVKSVAALGTVIILHEEKVRFARCSPLETLSAFSVGSVDTHVAMHLLYHPKIDPNDPSRTLPEALAKGGLQNSQAYKQALGLLPLEEEQNSSGGGSSGAATSSSAPSKPLAWGQ